MVAAPQSPAVPEVRDLTIPGSSGDLPARLYRNGRRGRAAESTLLVFFHGGGFVEGDLDSIDPCMREMVTHIDGAILAATYALAPERRFPTAVEDAYAVIEHCAKQPKRCAWTGQSLLVGGVEAGGNLAAVAALMARDRGGPALAAQILMMPMLDPGLSSGSMRGVCPNALEGDVASRCVSAYRDYLPRAADRTHPYASPLMASRLKGLPRTLIVSVEGDPLAGEADTYARKLEAAGVGVEILCLDSPGDREFVGDATVRCTATTDLRFHRVLSAFIAASASSRTRVAHPPVVS